MVQTVLGGVPTTVQLLDEGAPLALNRASEFGSVIAAAWAGDITVATWGDPEPRVLSSSQWPKKNVCPLTSGPPKVKPPWFWVKRETGPGCPAAVRGVKKSRE